LRSGSWLLGGCRPAKPLRIETNHAIVRLERRDLLVPLACVGDARVRQHQRFAGAR
jgi:hypothetical protein